MTKPDQENNLITFVYKSGVTILPGLAIRIKVLLPHFCEQNMKKQDDKIIYGAYYRKSSEDSERQINSISDQQRELEAIELRENLNVKI